MDDCLFCKIVAGELPAARVYENDRVVAIMDIFPATRGHALVIPRAHAADIHELPLDDLARPLEVANVDRVVEAVQRADRKSVV